MQQTHYSIGISLGRYRVEEQDLGLVTVGKKRKLDEQDWFLKQSKGNG